MVDGLGPGASGEHRIHHAVPIAHSLVEVVGQILIPVPQGHFVHVDQAHNGNVDIPRFRTGGDGTGGDGITALEQKGNLPLVDLADRHTHGSEGFAGVPHIKLRPVMQCTIFVIHHKHLQFGGRGHDEPLLPVHFHHVHIVAVAQEGEVFLSILAVGHHTGLARLQIHLGDHGPGVVAVAQGGVGIFSAHGHALHGAASVAGGDAGHPLVGFVPHDLRGADCRHKGQKQNGTEKQGEDFFHIHHEILLMYWKIRKAIYTYCTTESMFRQMEICLVTISFSTTAKKGGPLHFMQQPPNF